MLNDHGIKTKYFDSSKDSTIIISGGEALEARMQTVRDKTVSWDLIPGISIKKITKDYEDLEKDEIQKAFFSRISEVLLNIMKIQGVSYSKGILFK